MSVRSLTALAVERDLAPPGTPAMGGQRTESADGTPATGGAAPQTYVDALTSAIPTEPLAAYTALVAIYGATVKPGAEYLPLRWWAFAGFLVLTAVSISVTYFQKSRRPLPPAQPVPPTPPAQPGAAGGSTQAAPAAPAAQQGGTVSGDAVRRLPTLELVTALVAAAAWGLAMPSGPLEVGMTGAALTLTKATIVVGGAAVVALLAPPLTKGTNLPKVP